MHPYIRKAKINKAKKTERKRQELKVKKKKKNKKKVKLERKKFIPPVLFLILYSILMVETVILFPGWTNGL